MNEWMHCKAGWIDGWMHGWMGGWVRGCSALPRQRKMLSGGSFSSYYCFDLLSAQHKPCMIGAVRLERPKLQPKMERPSPAFRDNREQCPPEVQSAAHLKITAAVTSVWLGLT